MPPKKAFDKPKPLPKRAPTPKGPKKPAGTKAPPAPLKFGAGKSACVHLLAEQFPDAFIHGKMHPAFRSVKTIAIDAIQILKGLTSDKTGRELVSILVREAEISFVKYPWIETVVILFDKYKYVDLTKGVEQAKRGGHEPADFSAPSLDEKLPDDFERAKLNRDACPDIIRYVVRHWLTDCPPFVPMGKRIIVDGHYLQPEDLEGIIEDIPNDIYGTPICLENDKDRRSIATRLFTEGQNSLGEADFTMPFLLHLISPNDGVAVFTTDSDSLWLLSRLAERKTKGVVLWRYKPNPTWCQWSPRADIDRYDQHWCCISDLYNYVSSSLPKLAYPVTSLFVACISGGCDYVDPVPRLPPHHWERSFMNNSQFIGDLVYSDGKIDREAFGRLHFCAENQGAAGREVDFLVKGNHKLVAQKVSEAERDLRLLHVQYYLCQLDCVGEPVLRLPDPIEYGYAPADPAMPISRKNIVRRHAQQAPPKVKRDGKSAMCD